MECKICFEIDDTINLISPCHCRGSLKYVHLKCLNKWVDSRNKNFTKCEICQHAYDSIKFRNWHPRVIKKFLVTIFLSILLGYLIFICWNNKYFLIGNYWTRIREEVISFEPLRVANHFRETKYWAYCPSSDVVTMKDLKRYEYCEKIEKISPMDKKKINCETVTKLGFKNIADNCNCIGDDWRIPGNKVLCRVLTTYAFQINYGYRVNGRLYLTRNTTGSCSQDRCGNNIFRPMWMTYSNDDHSIHEVEKDWIQPDFFL
ncbi:MAG: putative E3 ubiquitin-protein ligase MARCH3-like [Hyperionvirus sp.]|uniref:E3 ubiquitin-protein ligase LAP n=1 Tax=Hyperionvirus sp. TaxID=2487770 RepID=A0A3G5AD61_9VIRU|nr:MAG: putative E3 ubiquitin-protein ligase MARCH3-like [Hyperionvirus sp.]